MKQPDISFILTCYNLQHYVEAAIRSLLAQEGNYSFELIVIDDCSTDDSTAVIAAIQDERICFVRHEQNCGAAASINEAFGLARGRYIGRFDADDVWLPHFLTTTVPVLDHNPEVGLVYGDISIINADGEVIDPYCKVPDYNTWDKPKVLKALLSNYLICAPAVLARREAWALALPLPETLLYCDLEMVVNISANWELRHVPQILAQYRLHAQNMHSTAIRQRRAEHSIFDTFQRFRQQHQTILGPQAWKEVYQERYLQLGDHYFGAGEMLDARRCYWRGQAYLTNRQGHLRRWLATFLPANAYTKVKRWWFTKGNAARN